MTRARRARKLLGGSMRQAGVVAAAGHRGPADRHRPARRGSPAGPGGSPTELRLIGGLRVLTPRPATNFVLVDVAPSGRTAEDVVADLKRHGINASSRPPTTIRFVTHRQIGDDDVATLVKTLAEVIGDKYP